MARTIVFEKGDRPYQGETVFINVYRRDGGIHYGWPRTSRRNAEWTVSQLDPLIYRLKITRKRIS